MCCMSGLCVEILEWPRIFSNINKSSFGKEQVLEYSTRISIVISWNFSNEAIV